MEKVQFKSGENETRFEVNYLGDSIVGNRESVISTLRVDYRLTMDEIGDLVGLTRQRIQKLLEDLKLDGILDYPELKDATWFARFTDEEIALKLRLRLFTVIKARKRLFLEKKKTVNMKRRRRDLVNILFDNKYLPGENFIRWLNAQIDDFPPKSKERMYDFYIRGNIESLSKHINHDTGRVGRAWARTKLKNIVIDIDRASLVDGGVLIVKRNIKSK